MKHIHEHDEQDYRTHHTLQEAFGPYAHLYIEPRETTTLGEALAATVALAACFGGLAYLFGYVLAWART